MKLYMDIGRGCRLSPLNFTIFEGHFMVFLKLWYRIGMIFQDMLKFLIVLEMPYEIMLC